MSCNAYFVYVYIIIIAISLWDTKFGGIRPVFFLFLIFLLKASELLLYDSNPMSRSYTYNFLIVTRFPRIKILYTAVGSLYIFLCVLLLE